jgi:hypothetical protein
MSRSRTLKPFWDYSSIYRLRSIRLPTALETYATTTVSLSSLNTMSRYKDDKVNIIGKRSNTAFDYPFSPPSHCNSQIRTLNIQPMESSKHPAKQELESLHRHGPQESTFLYIQRGPFLTRGPASLKFRSPNTSLKVLLATSKGYSYECNRKV